METTRPPGEHTPAGDSQNANGHDNVPVPEDQVTLKLSEVIALLRIKPDVARRWDRSGTLKAAYRTPGGHRRWRVTDVIRALCNPDGRPAGNRRRQDVSTADIVRMREAGGMTWQDIGRKVGMTPSGARKRYERGGRPATRLHRDRRTEMTDPGSLPPAAGYRDQLRNSGERGHT